MCMVLSEIRGLMAFFDYPNVWLAGVSLGSKKCVVAILAAVHRIQHLLRRCDYLRRSLRKAPEVIQFFQYRQEIIEDAWPHKALSRMFSVLIGTS
jgi:hypothetical protein